MSLRCGAWGRLRYSCGVRRRPLSVVGMARLLWHDFVIHPIFEGRERCQDCGRDYVLWGASDDLWLLAMSSPSGLLCPACFDKRLSGKGVCVKFWAARFPEHERDERPVSVEDGQCASDLNHFDDDAYYASLAPESERKTSATRTDVDMVPIVLVDFIRVQKSELTAIRAKLAAAEALLREARGHNTDRFDWSVKRDLANRIDAALTPTETPHE